MRKDRFAVGCVAALLAVSTLILPQAMLAATPSSGTLAGGGTLTYTGATATENPANFDPSTCQTAGYCDVFTLTINVSNSFRTAHPNFRVNISVAIAISVIWRAFALAVCAQLYHEMLRRIGG